MSFQVVDDWQGGAPVWSNDVHALMSPPADSTSDAIAPTGEGIGRHQGRAVFVPGSWVGERVRIVPNHVCVSVNLQSRLWYVRGEEISRSLAVRARGWEAEEPRG